MDEEEERAEKVDKEEAKTKSHLGYPFKQAFCMASMVYRRNSCASS